MLRDYVPSYVANEKQQTTLNVQLRSALRWWLRVLPTSTTQREIQNQLGQRTVSLAYSDEDGSSASVGVAVWGTTLKSPLAAFLEVPSEARVLWSSQQEICAASFWDISKMEAVPLVILATWPRLCAGSLWINFIDTAAAIAPLVNGSSSVTLGDDIVGLSWDMIAHHRIIPWFDRVDSANNAVYSSAEVAASITQKSVRLTNVQQISFVVY